MNECKPLGVGVGLYPVPSVGWEAVDGESDPRQGLTLVHYSAQRQHVLWDMLGA